MPKILWMSPHSVHDTSSGESANARSLIKKLQKRGFKMWVCSTFIFSSQGGATQAFGDLHELFSRDDNNIFIFDEDGVHYIYTRATTTVENYITLAQSQLYYNTFVQLLNEYQPDLIIGMGNSPMTYMCFKTARAMGIKTHYILSKKDELPLPCDLLTTSSQELADEYAHEDKVAGAPDKATALGQFFDLKEIVVPVRQKRFVTIINPLPSKGLSIFAKLAHICQERLPSLNFLVVNGATRFSNEVVKLHDDKGEHPFTHRNFPNVFMVDNQKDIRKIYSITHVLLVPNFNVTTWSRVATEATLNFIPVLATKSTGMQEATGDAGILLEIPKKCLDDVYRLPTDKEIEPWFEALEHALNLNNLSHLDNAMRLLDSDNKIEDFIECISPFIAQSAADAADDAATDAASAASAACAADAGADDTALSPATCFAPLVDESYYAAINDLDDKAINQIGELKL